MRSTHGVRGTLAGIVVAAMLVSVASAAAAALPAEPTRDQYVDAAEPICKSNVQANKRIFKGAEGKVKRGELKQASRHFLRAATAFNKTIRQLAVLPRPPADGAKLKKWLGLLRTERNIIRGIGRALAANKKRRAESRSLELNRNSSKANNSVLAFGFDYCRIEPSRFG